MWWGLLLAVVGAALIAGVDVTVSRRAVAGDGLALLGAICAGGYVLAGARARERLSTSAYAVVCYSTCALVLAVAALIARVPLAGFSARDWWLIAAITFVAQLLGHTLFNLVVPAVGPTIVSLAILLEVPGALIVALVLLDQAPPLLALPGHGGRRRRRHARRPGRPRRRRWSSPAPEGCDHGRRDCGGNSAVATLR